ncbi:MAG: arylesterase [Pseudomonadota bacterium]
MRGILGRLRSLGYGAGLRLRNLAAALLVLPGAASAEPLVIAALGDSLTAGYGLPVEDGFVPQLERWLTEQGANVEVRNAGVSGDTTRGGLSRAAWTLTDDVGAMIVTLGGNDLLRGIDPASSRENLAGILQAAAEAGVEVLMFSMAAPGNYGPDYKRDFDAMYPELASEFDVLLGPDFLQPLMEAADGGFGTFMQPDGIHPNATGVSVIVEGLGPTVLSLVERAQ